MKDKLTAVNWLLREINNQPSDKMLNIIIEQAKQMEQDQLDQKYGEGYNEGLYDALNK